MKKKLLLLLTTFFLCTTLIGCSKKTTTTESKKDEPVKATLAPKSQENKLFSPFTGEETTESSLNNIPIMTIIENSRPARPQSGLNKADIVYETMAEGGIPRFIALFQRNNVEKIGPIRSARPYFIDLSLEYNLPFGHCGGSAEALNRIKKENLMSMNEISYGRKYFWRDNTRKSPHNLYTSTDKLRNLAKSKGYVKPTSVKFNFDKTFWEDSSLETANTIYIVPNRTYETTYTYKDNKYYKSMDNKDSQDRDTSESITAKNIVIQFTNINLQKDGCHLDINLVGRGSGYVISNGKFIKMNWKKSSITSQTKLFTEDGKLIPLCPGNTWWHIVDNNTNVKIN